MAPLFQAAARREVHGSPAAPVSPGARSALVEAHELVFRYRDRGQPILRGCSLRIAAGDRFVLEGASGGGKSTFASLLAGLRHPESGLLLVGGLDRHTLGPRRWRQLVAAAPQFHENHVLTGSFAFNLFLGRQRLLVPKDFEEAETICRELGLGELLQRMPASLLQLVGETGWQLSHGERSRLYIARALLQGAPGRTRRKLRCARSGEPAPSHRVRHEASGHGAGDRPSVGSRLPRCHDRQECRSYAPHLDSANYPNKRAARSEAAQPISRRYSLTPAARGA